MVEDGVEEDGKMTMASVLTEVTVTVAALDDEAAADAAAEDEEEDWE